MTKKEEVFKKKIYSKIDSASKSIHDQMAEVLIKFANDELSEEDTKRIIGTYADTLTASAIGTIKLFKWRMRS